VTVEEQLTGRVRRSMVLWAVAACVALLTALYCVVWMIAAADLTFLQCPDGSSLFAKNPDCRIATYAEICAGAALLAALFASVMAVRSWRRGRLAA
jgi:hypothetical protein